MPNLKVKSSVFDDKWIKGTGEHTDEDPFVPQIELTDSNGYRATIDRATNALNIIDYAHHEVHSGSSFVTFANDADLDTDDELSIAFTTPDTAKWFHIVGIATCSGEALVEVLEGPTITNGTGTNQPVGNRDRNSANTSGALSIEVSPTANTVTVNPTITVSGAVLAAEFIGIGENVATGAARSLGEIILRQNTTYAFRVTGKANNLTAGIRLSWYEHINKN